MKYNWGKLSIRLTLVIASTMLAACAVEEDSTPGRMPDITGNIVIASESKLYILDNQVHQRDLGALRVANENLLVHDGHNTYAIVRDMEGRYGPSLLKKVIRVSDSGVEGLFSHAQSDVRSITLSVNKQILYSVATNPSDTTSTYGRWLFAHNIGSGKILFELSLESQSAPLLPQRVVVSPCGRYAAVTAMPQNDANTGSANGKWSVIVIDLVNNAIKYEALNIDHQLIDPTFSQSGEHLYFMGFFSGKVYTLTLRDGSVSQNYEVGERAELLAGRGIISDQEKTDIYIYSGGRNGTTLQKISSRGEGYDVVNLGFASRYARYGKKTIAFREYDAYWYFHNEEPQNERFYFVDTQTMVVVDTLSAELPLDAFRTGVFNFFP